MVQGRRERDPGEIDIWCREDAYGFFCLQISPSHLTTNTWWFTPMLFCKIRESSVTQSFDLYHKETWEQTHHFHLPTNSSTAGCVCEPEHISWGRIWAVCFGKRQTDSKHFSHNRQMGAEVAAQTDLSLCTEPACWQFSLAASLLSKPAIYQKCGE